MVQLKHFKGFDEDLKRGTTKGRKSDAFYKEARKWGIKKRPEGNYHHNAVRNEAPKWDNWELKYKDILEKDELYKNLKKEYDEIIGIIEKLEKEKNYREEGRMIEAKWKKGEELNKRFNDLEYEYKFSNPSLQR